MGEVMAPAWSRAIRVGRFIAITVVVALSFRALTQGSANFVAWAFNRDKIGARWALPDVKSECGPARLAALGSAPAGSVDATVARRASWQLGFNLGLATGLRNAGTPPGAPQLAQRAAERAALAQGLGVPHPEIPPAIHTAEALHEFEVYLEQDPQCTAAALAKIYSPACGAGYQFGAALGHAWFYRSQLPQLGPLFVPQLHIYGERAGVPADLWAPATEDLSRLSLVKAQKTMADVVSSIDRFYSQPGQPRQPPK